MFRAVSMSFFLVLGAAVCGAAAGVLDAQTDEGGQYATVATAPEAIFNPEGLDHAADKEALPDPPPGNDTDAKIDKEALTDPPPGNDTDPKIDKEALTDTPPGNDTDTLTATIGVNETIHEPDNATTAEGPDDAEEDVQDKETVHEQNSEEDPANIEVQREELHRGNETNGTLSEVVQKLPSNDSVKETIFEPSNITNSDADTDSMDSPAGNDTQELGATENVIKLPSNETVEETVNERNVTTEDGPTKVVVHRLERSLDNETEVAVTEVVEKLPSNETVKETIVERKTLTINETDGEKPNKTVKMTEVESQKRVCGIETAASEDNDWQGEPGVQSAINDLQQALRLLKELQEEPGTEPCQIIETAVLVQEKEVDSISED